MNSPPLSLTIQERMSLLKAKSEVLEGTPEQHLKLMMHLCLTNPYLLFPNCEPILKLFDSFVPRIRQLTYKPQASYLIRCPNCGELVGSCYIKPVFVWCSCNKTPKFGQYHIQKLGSELELDLKQMKQLDILYTEVLGEYYALGN
jgi:hypothetical protein